MDRYSNLWNVSDLSDYMAPPKTNFVKSKDILSPVPIDVSKYQKPTYSSGRKTRRGYANLSNYSA